MLEALNDHESAAPVLGDWLLGSLWNDERVCALVYGPSSDVRDVLHNPGWKKAVGSIAWFHANAAQPTPTFVRAIAAVLLFGNWSVQPWPCCRRRLLSFERADGAELDTIAFDVYGLVRMEQPLGEFETDEQLRARCLAVVRSEPGLIRLSGLEEDPWHLVP